MSKQKLPEGWKEVELGDVLDYEQPTHYIVSSEEYDDSYETPVLTAGKSFLLGHTNETEGIYTKLPVIIFDDFTTASQFVTFPFKVKSSAMKLLTPKTKDVDLKFIFWLMQTIKVDATTHKRYYLSKYQHIKIALPPPPTQKKIVSILEKAEAAKELRKEADELTNDFLKSVFLEMFGDPITNSMNWPKKQIIEIIKLRRGFDLPTHKRSDGKYPVMASNGLHSYHNEYKIRGPGIITGRSGTIGEVHYVNDEYWPLNTALYSEDMNNNNPLFLLYFLRFFKLKRFVRGAGTPTLNRNLVHAEYSGLPPISLQNKVASIVKQVETLKDQQKHSKNQIDNIFNVLMQKAFKGELIQ
jgi:type I restriction enzyme, S subunit